MVNANFGWIQKIPAISFSSVGKAENQGLETVPESSGAPRLISLTRRLAKDLARVVRRNRTRRNKPKRVMKAARRQTVAPIETSFWSRPDGGLHSDGATGSNRSMPATSLGKRAAKTGMVSPAKEWPTKT